MMGKVRRRTYDTRLEVEDINDSIEGEDAASRMLVAGSEVVGSALTRETQLVKR